MRGLLFLLLIGVTRIVVYSQQYHIRVFSQESKLPTATVFSFLQDKRGFIWMGTDGNGVYRYDGQRSVVYDKSNILTDNVSRALLQDSRDRVWIGTDKGGIVVYDGIKSQKISLTDEESCQVLSLCESFDHSVWVGTTNGGLFHVIEKAGTFKVRCFNKGNSRLSTNFVFDIKQDKYHRLWLGLLGGINVLTIQSDTIQSVHQLDADYGDIPDNFILDIEEDKTGCFWFATRQKGAFRINPPANLDKITVEPIQTVDPQFPDLVWDVFCDSHGVIWFATDKRGVARLDGKEINYISQNNGLPSNQITQVFEDYEHNMWFASVDAGLCQLLDLNFVYYSKKEGLPESQIVAVLNKRDSALLSVESKGLYYLYGNSIKPLSFSSSIDVSHIKQMCRGAGNTIWMSSSDEIGAMQNNVIHKINTDVPFFDNNRIKCIYYDSHQRLWVGTEDGIAYYQNGEFQISVNGKGLFNNVSCIIEDLNHTIWVGSLGGLAHYKGNEVTYYDEHDGLTNSRITVLQCDGQNNIWVGTNDGCFVLKQSDNNKIVPLNDKRSTVSGIIKAIAVKDSLLVVGTNGGIVVAIQRGGALLKSRCFDKTDCLAGIDVCANGIAITPKKTMIGTSGGVLEIHSLFDCLADFHPKMHLSQVDLFYNSVDWSTFSKVTVDKWLHTPDKLELSYNNNTLSFSFCCKTYNNADKVLYSYSIDGHWSAWQKEGFVSFQQLDAGNYVFRSKALLPNGLEIEAKPFGFVIEPPFWKQIWFIAACIVLLVLLLVSYIKYREKRLREERDLLNRLVSEKTQEVTNQKEEIESQRDHIYEQSKQITDSILYAERIQRIMLPEEALFTSSFREYFVLFKPKDIVSGDFYWLAETNGIVIVAVADCTGHGVPGAFMSMLGISFLNSIVNEKHITHPKDILNELRRSIVTALKQDNTKKNQDGMDIALISFDKNAKRLYFSGANNPLWIVRDKELIEIKPDKMPIGIYLKMDSFSVKDVDLLPNDNLYLFSDGYSDQFGGPLGKKFKDKQLKELLVEYSDYSFSEQKEVLLDKIEHWKHFIDSGNEQVDDICIVGLRV